MESLATVLADLLAKFVDFLPALITALVIFIVSLYFAGVGVRLVKRVMERRKLDTELVLLITQVVRWAILILGIVVALQQIGFNVTAFLTGLGILGFTVGFALQDVSKNFIAGLLLLWQQPFEIGDVIEVNGLVGTVQTIDLRSTEIKTFDGKYILIPNADVFTSPITNYSRDALRREELTIGVAYGTDLELARKLVVETVSNIDGVVSDPPVQVLYNNFGASSIDFILYFWVDTKKSCLLAVKDIAVVQLDKVFAENNIEIPYPIQTVLLQQAS